MLVRFFFQAEDGIRDRVRSRGLGDVYKRQQQHHSAGERAFEHGEDVAAVEPEFAAPKRGWERLYVSTVLQADTGADLDFLVGSSGDEVSRESH